MCGRTFPRCAALRGDIRLRLCKQCRKGSALCLVFRFFDALIHAFFFLFFGSVSILPHFARFVKYLSQKYACFFVSVHKIFLHFVQFCAIIVAYSIIFALARKNKGRRSAFDRRGKL
jgi:hypothetical protein